MNHLLMKYHQKFWIYNKDKLFIINYECWSSQSLQKLDKSFASVFSMR